MSKLNPWATSPVQAQTLGSFPLPNSKSWAIVHTIPAQYLGRLIPCPSSVPGLSSPYIFGLRLSPASSSANVFNFHIPLGCSCSLLAAQPAHFPVVSYFRLRLLPTYGQDHIPCPFTWCEDPPICLEP